MLGFLISVIVTLQGLTEGQTLQVASVPALEFYWRWVVVLSTIEAVWFIWQIFISAVHGGAKNPDTPLISLLTVVTLLPTMTVLWLASNGPLLVSIKLFSTGQILLGSFLLVVGCIFETISLFVSWVGLRLTFS